MNLEYELSKLTINDEVIAREIQQEEEEAYVYSCLHDDERLARTLQDIEGSNLQTSLNDDENLARYLQRQDELNRSYIPQWDAPSTSRGFSYYNESENFWDHHHAHTRNSPNISTDSFQNPSVDENIDPTNMTYEELNELQDSIGDVSRGLSEKRMSKLPTHKYGSKSRNWWWQKKKKSFVNDSQCLICLVEYANGDKIITLPCNHIYHKDCISHWLKQNRVCCVCKAHV